MTAIRALLERLDRGETDAQTAINLTPSENIMSPLSRLPFFLDLHDRYFFDDLQAHGIHAFFGALDAGSIENEVLKPLLGRILGAQYIDVRPISGLSCMTVALAAIAEPGDHVYVVPPSSGGHASTIPLGRRLGLDMHELPMRDTHDLDLEALAVALERNAPRAVYIDQSTELFPIDPAPIRHLVDELSPRTRIHYDASHINGLIVTGALPNPLDRGAHALGGSTHKTLPGPHKGFLATNDEELAARFDSTAAVLVSQHQPAASVSLAITLLELQECGGDHYGASVLANARMFAARLAERGLNVAAADRGYTACHQVWIQPETDDGACELATRLTKGGLRLNRFGKMPGLDGPGFRMSVAEVTRLGAGRTEIVELADLLADAAMNGLPSENIRWATTRFRETHARPRFCFDVNDALTGLEQLLRARRLDPICNPASLVIQ